MVLQPLSLVDNGSSDACGIQTLALSKTDFTCDDIATNPNTVTLTVTDNNGNVSTANATVTVKDEVKPTFTRPADKTIYASTTCTYDASVIATGDVTNEADNCSIGLQATFTDAVMAGSCLGSKIITRTWSLKDNYNNTATNQIQTISVIDNTPPLFTTCAPSVTVAPNYAGCTSKLLNYTNAVTAADNCSAVTLTQSPPAGTALPLGPNTITITAKDACGNSSTCSFIVTVTKTLDVTISNSNPQLYYGYTLDQSSIIKGIPSGGVGPYKVVITMNRPLKGNEVTSSGDEIWTPGANTSGSLNHVCPPSGSLTLNPVSTSTNTITATNGYSVTATLMANATFTVTVTDANGCTISKETTVYSEDARCFAGNSGNAKVKICHRTGNSNDPCHEICVAESAVQAHLDHGDYIGSCLPNCVKPVVHTKIAKLEKKLEEPIPFNVIAHPNPTNNLFTIIVEGGTNEKVEVLVYDTLGRMVKYIDNSDGQEIKFGEGLPSGTYIAIVSQGINQKTVKLIKQ